MLDNISPKEKENILDRMWVEMWVDFRERGDNKCCFPCAQCRGFVHIRILIKLLKIIVGNMDTPKGNEYYLLVRYIYINYMSLY